MPTTNHKAETFDWTHTLLVVLQPWHASQKRYSMSKHGGSHPWLSIIIEGRSAKRILCCPSKASKANGPLLTRFFCSTVQSRWLLSSDGLPAMDALIQLADLALQGPHPFILLLFQPLFFQSADLQPFIPAGSHGSQPQHMVVSVWA